MKTSKLPKRASEKISRSFSIMFNRASMYRMDHPFTIQSVQDVYRTVTDGLNNFSPIVLILNRDNLFIEEEPFDQRLNTSKIVAHFKKAAIQSISFEKGMQKDELDRFVNILADLKNHPTQAAMKEALAKNVVSNIKINHVIYKKVTADDEIIAKEKLEEISRDAHNDPSTKMYSEVVNMMAESILMEEIEKSFSLESLLADPAKLSKNLIDQDLSMAQRGLAGSGGPGVHIADQLAHFRNEIIKVTENTDNLSLSELADAVFELKKQLIEGIESQKKLGIIYQNEEQIIDEASALTDAVLIQIVKDEYKKGEISIPRLAQILRRLVPQPDDLRRLLPKLSDALLEEGMSKEDFLLLIDALGKELQSENLVHYLQKGAEEIGIAAEDLIDEVKMDPSGAAELIYLASEIRKGTGDETVLTDLLVEYVERIGAHIALEETDGQESEATNHLKAVIANVESEIVNRLKKKGIDASVLTAVQQRLSERMEMCFDKLKTEMEHRKERESVGTSAEMGKTTIFRVMEESVQEGEELHTILKQVRASFQEQGIDENNVQQLLDEIQRLRQEKDQHKEKKSLPNGILSYKNTLLFIEKEISRCLRYETPFSVLTFSVEKILPEQPVPRGAVNGHEINNFIMGELVSILRESDLVGILTKKIIVVLLPMTEKANAKIALSRILKALHSKCFKVKDLPLKVRFAGAVSSFDQEQTPDFGAFIRGAENEHNDFLIRLRNIQDLY